MVTIKKVPFRRTVDGALVVITLDELVQQILEKLDPQTDQIKIEDKNDSQ